MNESDRRPVGNRYFLQGHSWIQLYKGDHKGRPFIWAPLGNASPGSLLDLWWTYSEDNSWYQCGDTDGNPQAKVLSGSHQTWTAGVPLSSVGTVQAHVSDPRGQR